MISKSVAEGSIIHSEVTAPSILIPVFAQERKEERADSPDPSTSQDSRTALTPAKPIALS